MSVSRFSLLLFLLIGSISISAQTALEIDEESAWLKNIDEAKSTAVAHEQFILMSFSGSDWCLPCMRLEKELFSTEEFIGYAEENLVLLKLDFPARKKNELPGEQVKHNEALAEKYNQRGSFPLVVITDASGNVQGYMQHPLTSPEAYIQSISFIIEQ